ncbi:hypothetical protein [Confluentibacter sediminis]|nr:hypothetical protein [Confluentibacter sediminis]
MKLIVTIKQYDLLTKLYKPKFPVQFSGEIAPIVNDILKKANSLESRK